MLLLPYATLSLLILCAYCIDELELLLCLDICGVLYVLDELPDATVFDGIPAELDAELELAYDLGSSFID